MFSQSSTHPFRNKLTKFFISVSILLLTSQIDAGHVFPGGLNVIGFSQDGQHLGFEVYACDDKYSGECWSNYYFINVPNNSYKEKPVKYRGHEIKSTKKPPLIIVRQVAKELAKHTLNSLQIIDKNLGTHLVSHLPTDLSTDGRSVRFTTKIPGTINKKGYFDDDPTSHGDYQIRLIEYPGEYTKCPRPSTIFRLELINHKTGKVEVLQEDKKLPTSRGCAYHYRIQDVYLYRDYVAVFIAAYIPQFKNETYLKYMVVTGKLNK